MECLRKQKIINKNPNEIDLFKFLDGYDFDEVVEITPSQCDETLWNKMLDVTLDDYSALLSPETIVFCEGTTKGTEKKRF